jgi:hypothetical protein
LVAVPAYVVTNDEVFNPDPSTVTASVVAIASIFLLLVVLRRCTSEAWAVGGALAFALGTATWPISAGQLWPHGPGQLAAVLVLLALSSGHPAGAGAASALGILVRPVTAIVPAVLAIGALLRRQVREAIAIALPGALALVLVVVYNRWAFGSYSLSGGYQSMFRENVTEQTAWKYLQHVAAMVGSPKNGVLFWSPVVIVALLGLPRGWRVAPPWARQAAVAGLVYLLVHLRLNRASGGLPIDYRYPLEPMMLAAPLGVMAVQAFVVGAEWRRRVLVLALGASVFLQGAMALSYECDPLPNGDAECGVLGA